MIDIEHSQAQAAPPTQATAFVPDVLLIDANSIGYAAMYQPNLAKLAHNGQSTSALHGLPASIFKILRTFPKATPLILWDGRAQWRYDLYPDYKSNRGDTPEKIAIKQAYRIQVPYLRQLFFALGLPQMLERTAEADDLAGILARWLSQTAGLRVMMVSTDSDWVQAVDDDVHLYNPRTEQEIDLDWLASESFKDGPFDDPEQYLAAKCMAGDTSDAIEGVAGIGLKTGAKFLKVYGSFEALWERADDGEALKGVKLQSVATPEARALYARNRALMDWALAPMPPGLEYTMQRPDLAEALDLAAQFSLKHVARQIEAFHPRQDAWREHLSCLDSWQPGEFDEDEEVRVGRNAMDERFEAVR